MKILLFILIISFNLKAGFWDKLEKVSNKMDKIEEKQDKVISTQDQAERIEAKKRKLAGLPSKEEVERKKQKEKQRQMMKKTFENQICAQYETLDNMKKDKDLKKQAKLMEPQYKANIKTLIGQWQQYSKEKKFSRKKYCN
jgi:hypothetical protein